MNKFSRSSVVLIYRKELLDIVRDRRTLISMILIPLLIFPIIFMGFSSLAIKQMEKLESKNYPVGIKNVENWNELASYLKSTEQLTILEVGDPVDTLRSRVAEGSLKAAVILPEGRIQDGDKITLPEIIMYLDESSEESQIVGRKLREKLREMKDTLISRSLREINVSESILTPFELNEENVASEEQMTGMILGMLLPYMMIILTLTGGMYPAMDLAAGEKERSTLETLLVTPAGRMEIVLGKFLTVLTTSLVTAIMSLLSMALVIGFGLTSIMSSESGGMSFSINPMYLLLALAMMIPLAALFSSLLLTVSVFAKSTREAQSYSSPLLVVTILPAMMSMLPGATLTSKEVWIPIVNIALAMKDILAGQPDFGNILMVLLATSIYAFFGIFVTMKVFQKENVLFRV